MDRSKEWRRPEVTGSISPHPSGRKHGQRGAEALAGALVMMMILPLMFMIVDIGWGIFIKVSLQHAVREAVRYAITSRFRRFRRFPRAHRLHQVGSAEGGRRPVGGTGKQGLGEILRCGFVHAYGGPRSQP